MSRTSPSSRSLSRGKKQKKKAVATRELQAHPAVRNYMLFCLASLFLLVVCLNDRGLGWWCLLPSLIGALTLLLHWSLGPPLVLLSLMSLLLFTRVRYTFGYPHQSLERELNWIDVLLCLAGLAYVMGHYRLLSLVRHVFPPDPRRLDEPDAPAQRRSADLVSAKEMTLLAVAVPVWAGLALLIWMWMMASGDPPLGVPNEVWRVLRLIWVFVGVLVVSVIVYHFRRTTRATPEESLLYLQDEVWRHTRREQGNLNRWLSWTRLRLRRKKEAS